MRVCHVTSAHNTLDERIFGRECKSLANAGFDVFVVGKGESKKVDGVSIVGCGSSKNRLERMLFFSKRVYEEAKKLDCDVYHFHDPDLLRYALRCKRLGKKVIFDSHENYPEQIKSREYLIKPIAHMISFFYKLYETYVCKRIDAVIVPCTFNGKNIFENRCQKITYVSNAVRAELFESDVESTAEKKYDLCYFGALDENRGITSAIKAAYNAGVKLCLAGSFSDLRYKQQLEAMEEYACVEYKGVLNRNEIVSLLNQSRIGLHVLKDVGQYYSVDAFGVKVYEYFAVGLPVILFDSPYNRVMVEKYKFGCCVNATDIDGYMRTIKSILMDEDYYTKLSINSKRALEVFNWGREERRFIEFYHELEKV